MVYLTQMKAYIRDIKMEIMKSISNWPLLDLGISHTSTGICDILFPTEYDHWSCPDGGRYIGCRGNRWSDASDERTSPPGQTGTVLYKLLLYFRESVTDREFTCNIMRKYCHYI